MHSNYNYLKTTAVLANDLSQNSRLWNRFYAQTTQGMYITLFTSVKTLIKALKNEVYGFINIYYKMLKEGVLSGFRLVIISKYVWLNVHYIKMKENLKIVNNFFLSYNWQLGIEIVIKIKNLSRTNFGGFSLFTKGSILYMHYKLGRCFT